MTWLYIWIKFQEKKIRHPNSFSWVEYIRVHAIFLKGSQRFRHKWQSQLYIFMHLQVGKLCKYLRIRCNNNYNNLFVTLTSNFPRHLCKCKKFVLASRPFKKRASYAGSKQVQFGVPLVQLYSPPIVLIFITWTWLKRSKCWKSFSAK